MVFGKEYGLAYCSQSPYRISFSTHHPPYKHSPSSPTIANTWPFFTTLLTRLSRSNNTKTFSNSNSTMPSIPTSNGIFDETTTRKASHPLQTAKNASFSQQHSQLNPPHFTRSPPTQALLLPVHVQRLLRISDHSRSNDGLWIPIAIHCNALIHSPHSWNVDPSTSNSLYIYNRSEGMQSTKEKNHFPQ